MGNGFYDLLAIVQKGRELEKLDRQTGPLSCPNCGTLFEVGGPNGDTKFCKFDGYKPDEHDYDW